MTIQIQDTTLTLKYRQQWGLWESLREIIQNALDIQDGKFPKVTGNMNYTKISDNGSGMTLRQFFLLGISEKENENARGKFGEGLKIGMIILTRLGYKVTVKSKDWVAYPVITENFNEKLLSYRYEENKKMIQGTTIKIEGLSLETAKKTIENRFIVKKTGIIADNSYYGRILKSPYSGKLFNKDIFVNEINSVFGYDLISLRLGTDRSFADNNQITTIIEDLFQYLKGTKYNSILLNSVTNPDMIESTCRHYRFNPDMKKAFIKRYGEKTVISDSVLVMPEVTKYGYRLEVFPEHVYNGFSRAGIKTASQLISEKLTLFRAKSRTKFTGLDTAEKELIKECYRDMINYSLFSSYEFSLKTELKTLRFFEREHEEDKTMGGYFDPKTGHIGIIRTALSDYGELLKILIHEYTHKIYGTNDNTSRMQGNLDNHIKNLVNKIRDSKESILNFRAEIKKNHIGKYTQYVIKIPKKELSSDDRTYLDLSSDTNRDFRIDLS